MTRYTVTEEIKTTWLKSFLRKLNLEEPREEFDMVSKNNYKEIPEKKVRKMIKAEK